MARSLTQTIRQALFAQNTNVVVLLLVTIENEALEAPIRLTSNAVNTISRGNTFVRFPFDLTLPDDVEDRAPRAKLVVDNVSREIIGLVRTLPTQPRVTIEVIDAAAPDAVAETYGPFLFQNAEWDAMNVSGDLMIDDRSNEPFPEGTYNPVDFPALFKAV